MSRPCSGRARQGLIARYREWLPLADTDPVITLGEGSTPLVLAERLSDELGCETWVKVEGANPTGSFKDRGMTLAVSVPPGSGAKAVVCASTGNTSASAAAYASKAGLQTIVLLPAGRIATGKLAQAIVHGAKVVQVDGNFDDCLELARKLAELPGGAGQLGQPDPHRGAEDRGLRDRRRPRRRARPARAAGRQRRQHHRLLAGLHPVRGRRASPTTAPRMWGFQAAGAAPLVLGHPVLDPETVATAIRIGNPGVGHAGGGRPRRVGRR